MKNISKKSLLIFMIALGFGGLGVTIGSFFLPTGQHLVEIPVSVVEIDPPGKGLWSVPKDVAVGQFGVSTQCVLRLNNLRVEPLTVEVAAETDGRLELLSNDLKTGDLLVLRPGGLEAGQAVAITTGVNDERLIRLTIEAGMTAATAEDLDESVRFVSPKYRDNMGFNYTFIRQLLERAYDEFDKPHMEIADDLVIQIKGSEAEVKTTIRLSVIYQGRRNYLLGDEDSPNSIQLILDKSPNGWKLSRIEGLRPLGFEEKAFKLLGAQLGVPLTQAEQIEMQQFCMPCRQRMVERFGED
jgi:hypothetical protein